MQEVPGAAVNAGQLPPSFRLSRPSQGASPQAVEPPSSPRDDESLGSRHETESRASDRER